MWPHDGLQCVCSDRWHRGLGFGFALHSDSGVDGGCVCWLVSGHAVMGKAEGRTKDWHGHVTAVTVAPEFRRLGLAKRLMDELERVSEHMYVLLRKQARIAALVLDSPSLVGVVRASSYDAYFVDLFVRVSNAVAINMYKKFGYIVYRRVIDYYSGDEDAFGTQHIRMLCMGRLASTQRTRSTHSTDMRKALPRDKTQASVVPLDHPVHPHELWDY